MSEMREILFCTAGARTILRGLKKSRVRIRSSPANMALLGRLLLGASLQQPDQYAGVVVGFRGDEAGLWVKIAEAAPMTGGE